MNSHPVESWFIRYTPRILAGLLVVTLALIGVAVYLLTQYQPKTACQTNPAGKACQQLKVESDKARTPRSACVITRLAGLGCPALEDRRRKAKQNARDPRTPVKNGGDNATPVPGSKPAGGPPDSGGSSPVPSPPGSPGSPGDPGGQPVPPDPPEPPPAPPTPPPSNPPPKPPSVGNGVNSIVEGANETVHGVCSTVNSLGIAVQVPC